jgi:magnesium transporter
VIGKLLLPTIEDLIKARDFRTLKEELSGLEAADLAEFLEDIDEAHLSLIFRLLSKEKAADVFEHLDVDHQQVLLASLSREKVKDILGEMSVDDRTTLLDELPPQVASQLIELLPAEDRALAITILNYPEDSVGRLITPDYVSLSENLTVGEALERIRIFGKDMETVYACYVIGPNRKLLGHVSLRKLVTSPLDVPVKELQNENYAFVNTDTPQEEAVDILRRYDHVALPVLDRDGNMVGIVTFDDLMDVAEEEFREDMDLMAAVVPAQVDRDFLDESIMSVVLRRVPWLIALLIVEAAAVFILHRYDFLLERVIALSFFIPVLVATGGNTGTQSASMVISALAAGEVSFKDIWKLLSRSIIIGVILAAILGIAAYYMALLIDGNTDVGLCVGIGLATVVLLSNLAGGILPLLLKKVGLDPAIMSSPLISTIVDIFGLAIYMEVSLYFFKPLLEH